MQYDMHTDIVMVIAKHQGRLTLAISSLAQESDTHIENDGLLLSGCQTSKSNTVENMPVLIRKKTSM